VTGIVKRFTDDKFVKAISSRLTYNGAEAFIHIEILVPKASSTRLVVCFVFQ